MISDDEPLVHILLWRSESGKIPLVTTEDGGAIRKIFQINMFAMQRVKITAT